MVEREETITSYHQPGKRHGSNSGNLLPAFPVAHFSYFWVYIPAKLSHGPHGGNVGGYSGHCCWQYLGAGGHLGDLHGRGWGDGVEVKHGAAHCGKQQRAEVTNNRHVEGLDTRVRILAHRSGNYRVKWAAGRKH